MSKRRILSPKGLWDRHVKLVLQVLFISLEKLRSNSNLPREEKGLDQLLNSIAKDVYYQFPVSERPLLFVLIPQAEQTPISDEDLGAEWTRKKPDFIWRMQNNHASSPQEIIKDFVIECKRLAAASGLPKKYVDHGIDRFLLPSHRYGNNANDGAMIGYVQNSEPREILNKINRRLQDRPHNAIPKLHFPGRNWDRKPVMKTDQRLDRKRVHPADFLLHHLWVDLRRS